MENTDLDQAIKQHRMGTLTIKTSPNASVKVKQLKHEFWFGTCLARRTLLGTEHSEDMEKYRQVVKQNFNSAVHENALKWEVTEPEKDKVSYEGADKILEWCEENDIKMRGHCLYWEKPVHVQEWLKSLDKEELKEKVKNRAKDVLTRYKGRISEYDVNNEMLHGDFYKSKFGENIYVDMFKWAKDTDPDAKLYVNDYEILETSICEKYVEHIERLLENGAPIGGIGIQGHLLKGEALSSDRIKKVLDKLAQFNLPIKITEFDMRTLNEEAKVKGLQNLYKTCFEYPSVDGILMWGFWQNSHWLASSRNKMYAVEGYTALWKKDWTPTPSVDAYRNLVFDEWWTNREEKADQKGICSIDAFYGSHLVESNGRQKQVELKKEEREKEVNL
jgi:endo-1,4-beta-xylanase